MIDDIETAQATGNPGSNLNTDPAETAEERGQIVVHPLPTDLLIDIDTNEDRRHCYHMLAIMDACGYRTTVLSDAPSKSGDEHRHIYVRCDRVLTPEQRIALQAACGSDRKRELLSMLRTWGGTRPPTLLFEAPGFVYPEPAPTTPGESRPAIVPTGSRSAPCWRLDPRPRRKPAAFDTATADPIEPMTMEAQRVNVWLWARALERVVDGKSIDAVERANLAVLLGRFTDLLGETTE